MPPLPDEFLKTLPMSIQDRLLRYGKYKDYSYRDELNEKSIKEHEQKKKDLKRFESDLNILTEQEGEVNTSEEERLVKYWGEEKERETIKNQNAIRIVEEQLARMKQSAFEKEVYYANRLRTAEENLERKRNYRSKPRIRLEMKISELNKYFQDQDDKYKGHTEYQKVSDEISALYIQYKAEKARQLKRELYETSQPKASGDPTPPEKIVPKLVPTKGKRRPKEAREYPKSTEIAPEAEAEPEPSSCPADA